MQWGNSNRCWGLVQVLLHWTVALLLIGLFGLGLWMTGLDYYSPWYQAAPDWHRAIGLLVALLLLVRLLWRLAQPVPRPLPTHRPGEVRLAHAVHWLLYLLITAIAVSGYLTSTADGRPIDWFGWFEVPALVTGGDQMEQWTGRLHELLAWVLALLVGLHAGGALKHHFIDRDSTLTRMLGRCLKQETP